MHVYYTRIICLLVEDVDIVISFSSSNQSVGRRSK